MERCYLGVSYLNHGGRAAECYRVKGYRISSDRYRHIHGKSGRRLVPGTSDLPPNRSSCFGRRISPCLFDAAVLMFLDCRVGRSLANRVPKSKWSWARNNTYLRGSKQFFFPTNNNPNHCWKIDHLDPERDANIDCWSYVS